MTENATVDILVKQLLATEDPINKAAIVAEMAFDQLATQAALVARRCVVFRWFDETIIAALLDMMPIDERLNVARAVLETLSVLSFVEKLEWGLTYHSQTRMGLLVRTPPVVLQEAAALALPAYLAHACSALARIETLYCAVAAGQQEFAAQRFEDLLEETGRQKDWQAILALFQALDQASTLPGVVPISQTSLHYCLRGLASHELGDFAGAIAAYSQAIVLAPSDAVPYHNRGRAWYDQGDFTRAIADYDEALAFNPNDTVAYNSRGLAWQAQGDLTKAMADYGQAIALAPHDPVPYYNRGLARQTQGDLVGAMTDYDQALDLEPEDAIGHRDQSPSVLEPDDVATYHNRSLAWHVQSDIAEAIANAYTTRGLERYNQGDFAGAIADYDRAMAIVPNDAVLYYNRGLARQSQGDLAEAIVDYDQAIALQPDYAAAYNNQGLALYAQGDLVRAIASYDQAIALEPGEAVAHYNRGLAWQAHGELAKAIADYNQAIALEPNYDAPYYARVLAQQALSELSRATIDYAQFPTSEPTKETPMRPSILLCTVGTSLFRPNLEGLKNALATETIAPERRPLAEAYTRQDWTAVAQHLTSVDAHARLCGAEINSIASLLQHQHVAQDCGLFFLHSDTPDGLAIATILQQYYQAKGHALVEAVPVADLQDRDPKRFRTRGLRQLARELCKILHERSPAACAINATGGYKAQIAIAVLLGQALGVPVYYKHELFDEIIAFPPMPVALDFELWMRASGMLFDLVRNLDPAPARLYTEEWQETYESLVERVRIEQEDYLELSATGQIFHDTFRERFRSSRDRVLPPGVPPGQKRPPRLEDSGHMHSHPEIHHFLEEVTAANACVSHCATFYYNPDLGERTRFRLGSRGIEGIFSDGSYTVKFRLETSAQTPGQEAAVVAALNEWLDGQH